MVSHGHGLSDALPDEVVEKALQACHVPGIAIAIIKDNKITSKGYGFSDLESKIPVTPDTLFPTGSTTKTFTAAAASLMVCGDEDEFKDVDWETPMRSILQEDFVLESTTATSGVTLEDCIVHRTGIPSHHADLGAANVRDSTRRLRHLPLTAAPREKWQYSNHMYWAVCHAVETRSGLTMQEFLQRRLWSPLGMTSTFLELADARSSGGNLALPYAWDEEKPSFRRLDIWDDVGLSGAGGCVSTINDFARWVQALLSKAGPLSRSYYEQAGRPKILTTEHPPRFGEEPVYYGLGWYTTIYRGERVVYHPGGLIGWTSYIVTLPERNLGLCAMCNATSELVLEAPIWHVIDDILDVPAGERMDTLALVPQMRMGMKAYFDGARERLFPSEAILKQGTSLPPSSYAGSYAHPSYGIITIDSPSEIALRDDDASLNGRFPGRLALDPFRFEHIQADTFFGMAEVAGGVVSVRIRARFEISPPTSVSETSGAAAALVNAVYIEFTEGEPAIRFEKT